MSTTRRGFSLAIAAFGCACAVRALPACSSSSAAPARLPNGSITIKLAQSPWDASRIDVAIARALLVEKLGYRVEVTEIDERAQWIPISRGELHAQLEVWPSGHVSEIASLVDTGKVEDGGKLGPLGKINWYVPSYLVAQHPELATWTGFKDPALVEMFRTPETGTHGRFLSGDRTWTQHDADIIRNLGLDLQVVYARTEEAELAELARAYGQREAILLYLWLPHSALERYDLTAVQLPPYSDACYAKAATGGIDCDYPAEQLFKIFWPGLAAYAPDAYQLLKSFQYSTKDQIDLLALLDNENVSVDAAAHAWIDANTTTWRPWLPASTAAAVTGSPP